MLGIALHFVTIQTISDKYLPLSLPFSNIFLTTLCGFCHFVWLSPAFPCPAAASGTKRFPTLHACCVASLAHSCGNECSQHTHTHQVAYNIRREIKNKRQKTKPNRTKPSRATPRTVGKQWQWLMAPAGLAFAPATAAAAASDGYGNYTQHTRAHISGNNNSAQEASPGVSFQ